MRLRTLIVVALLAAAHGAARAQAGATATLPVQVSAFAGVTGAYTGLESSRNLSFTGGVDVGVRSFFGLNPAIEVRGTYPFADGRLVAEKSLLGGIRLAKRYTRLRPYADVLYGRGQLDYLQGGYPSPSHTYVYQVTSSNIIAGGVGVDVDFARHLGLKADVQIERFPTPAVASGAIYAKPFTLGIVYRLGF